MYCSSCGHANDNNACKCVACGNVLQGAASSAPDTPSAPDPSPAPGPASAAGHPPISRPVPVPFGDRPNVPNHLIWAILATLFCCLPGGIVAIVYAAQVDGKVASGDIAGAQAASRNAVTWCWVSAGAGVIVCVLYVFLVFGSLASRHY